MCWDFTLYSVEFDTFYFATRVTGEIFNYQELALLANFGFPFSEGKSITAMATSNSTKVLILGHSFVRHLANDLRRECVDRAIATFDVSGLDVRMYGVGGQTVKKLRDNDLHQVATYKPDILVLEIGANDLIELAPEVVGSAMEDLVCLLHKTYWVKIVAVSARGQFNKEITLVVFTCVIYTCKVRLVNTRIQ